MNHSAILALYPQVTLIRGDEAFDAAGNPVIYDKAAVQAYVDATAYKDKRAIAYPDFREYLDGIVKGDQEQIDAYIAACKAVKDRYPKP